MSDTSVLFDAPGPRARRRNNLLTVVGTVIIVALVAFVLFRLADNGQFDAKKWRWIKYGTIRRNILLDGVIATLKAFALSASLSVALGLLLAVGRLSAKPWARWPATGFVTVFRALPVVVLIFFPYVGGPSLIGRPIPLLWCVVFGLTVYNSSVLAEVFRAGVLAVPKGQTEAAMSIGLNRGKTLRLVLFPQAVRTMLPTIISQLVVVLKDTALGFVIGYQELLVKGQEVARAPQFGLPYIPISIVVGGIYIALCSLLSLAATQIEKRTGAVKVSPDDFGAKVGEDRAIEDLAGAT